MNPSDIHLCSLTFTLTCLTLKDSEVLLNLHKSNTLDL